MRLLAKSTMCMDPEKFCFSTPCQNHLYIEDESQNFDEMRAVGSSSPRGGDFAIFQLLISPPPVQMIFKDCSDLI